MGEIQYLKLNNFFKKLNKLKNDPGDLVVRMEIKYSYEKEYHTITEVLTQDERGQYEWLHDWDEGYSLDPDGVRVISFCAVDDLHFLPQAAMDYYWKELEKDD